MKIPGPGADGFNRTDPRRRDSTGPVSLDHPEVPQSAGDETGRRWRTRGSTTRHRQDDQSAGTRPPIGGNRPTPRDRIMLRADRPASAGIDLDALLYPARAGMDSSRRD